MLSRYPVSGLDYTLLKKSSKGILDAFVHAYLSSAANTSSVPVLRDIARQKS